MDPLDPEVHSRQVTSPLQMPDTISWPSITTKQRMDMGDVETRKTRIAEAIKVILEAVGEDPEREGLQKTPLRYANALLFFTRGYEESLPGRKAF